MREAVSTAAAPAAIGPYSQAVRAGSLVFVSGQIPLDPATGTMVDGPLADMNDFAAMNEVYGSYFSAPAPARSTIQAARLPRDARVEVDVIAEV